VTSSKPSPEIFDAARARGKIDPSAVLSIGDSVWDIGAARAARMGCVSVESGGFSRSELAGAGALAVYRDVQDLCDQLFTSPIATLVQRVEPR
jgi:phosphoglycolate phosphatase-like HAD superfamily hydrolase